MTRYLVLTADELTWRLSEPMLFMGEWCLLHERRDFWRQLDYKVARPYGVKLEEKERDNKLVEHLIKSHFGELVESLNEYHGENKTERYWKILLGEWLIRYTALYINRYQTLKQTLDENRENLRAVICADNLNISLAAKDTLNFTFAANDVSWNSFLYSRLLGKLNPNIAIINISKDENKAWSLKEIDKFVASKYPALISFGKHCQYSFEKFFINLFFRSRGLLINTYLNKKFLIRFFIYLYQLPRKYKSFNVDEVKTNLESRRCIPFQNVSGNDFDSLYKKFLIELIPTCFLEGYEHLKKKADHLPWQNSPAFIFTSNSYCYDEVFQMWAAKKAHEGSRFFIGQHGANFGVLKYSHGEYLCKENADGLITWGWSDHFKCVPAFMFQMVGEKRNDIGKHRGDRLLLVQLRIRPSVDTWDNYHEFDLYMKEQFSFADHLCLDVRSELTVRLHSASSDDDWGTFSRWKSRFPDLIYDQGTTHFRNIIRSNKIVVFTYLSTGFNQMLYLNLPAVVFWNNQIEVVRDSAKDIFEELLEANVIFNNPIEAATHINKVWHDVDGWWSSKKVQNAIENYCQSFARSVDKPYKSLKFILKGN